MKTTEKIAGEYSIDSTCVTITSTTNSTSTTTGALVVAGGVGVAKDICVGGNLYATGNTVIGDANTDSVCFTADVISHIIPDTDETYNLGSATQKWNCIFVKTNAAGILSATDTTNSTSTSTGAITTAGGIGVACDAYIAGKLTMSNVIQLHTATSDPAGAEGQIYYKSDTCKFRGYANGAWTDLH